MASNLFGVLFTVASVPLVVLLLIIYYAKNKFSNARTKLFRIMMWTLLIGCFLEITKVLLINNDTHKILLEAVSRLDFTFKTIWWYVLELYTVISYQKETLDDKNIRKSDNKCIDKCLGYINCFNCLSLD